MLQDDENQRLSDSPSGITEREERAATAQNHRLHPFWFDHPRLRAVWRVFVFLVLVRVILTPVLFSAVRPFRFRVEATLDYVAEALVLLAVVLGTLIMARFEKRSFFDYGLRDRNATLDCLKGAITGYAAITVMLLGFEATHHSRFGLAPMHTSALMLAALLNIFEFALTALYEELAFRGYTLFTLTEAIGFWPAALAMSLFFAWEHTQNPGESRVGITAVFAFGMVLAFSVWRTGSLLWAIGFHFMWDYSETFLYGVPDSGLASPSHLLSTKLSGPTWVTGGSVGPEGSYFIFVVLAAIVVAIHVMYPNRAFGRSGDRAIG